MMCVLHAHTALAQGVICAEPIFNIEVFNLLSEYIFNVKTV